MSVRIPQHSRLQFASLGLMDGVEFWDLVDLPTLPVQPDDLQYTVLGTDRIDSISASFYGDPKLWWVIAAANDLEILPTELYVGQTLRIPSPRYVLQQLFQKAQNG